MNDNRSHVNLYNVNRGIEMIKHEIHQQDMRIKELENLLVVRNREIVKLKEEFETLERKYTAIFSSVTRLGLGKGDC